MKPTIAISMDMDWAPDAVIADSLELLSDFHIRATLFMTNRTTVVENSGHELGIHPHFTSLDLEKHLRERLDDFPQARGTRSHTLFDTYRLQPIYKKLGLEYQSNVYMHRQQINHPYRISDTMIETPVYYSDNIYMMIEGGAPPSIDELGISEPGLKVFSIHPIHVCLNTENLERYESAKAHYHDPRKLLEYRNTQVRGIRDLFLDLLKYMRDENIPAATLLEIAREYRASF
jgi:hypothetical protein